MTRKEKSIEEARAKWAGIAKENGWYSEPFFIQVWLGPDGTVYDAVSSTNLTQDITLYISQEEIDEEEAY